MGLDMYLKRKRKVKDLSEEQQVALKKVSGLDFDSLVLTEEVGYWRKANAIHGWLVANVQRGKDDCREYRVTPEKLKELLALCERVVAAFELVDGQTVANGLLPVTRGFFFGGQEYDQYYLQDIKDTIKIIKKALNSTGNIYYQSSW